MATTSVGFFPPAQDMRSISALVDKSSSDIPTQLTISSAIGTAVTGGLYTCTASLSGVNSSQAQALMSALRGLGYGVSYSGTTLTLTW